MDHLPELSADGAGGVAVVIEADVLFGIAGIYADAPEWVDGIGKHGVAQVSDDCTVFRVDVEVALGEIAESGNIMGENGV